MAEGWQGGAQTGAARFFSRTSAAVRLSTEFDLVQLAKHGPIHFMGIGGAGMSPLAEMALLAGARVTGCDSSPGPATQHMEERGATVYQGHHPDHVNDCAALVMTAAVRDDLPKSPIGKIIRKDLRAPGAAPTAAKV